MSEEFKSPNDVLRDLLVRCKEAKAWKISCYMDESWIPHGPAPFDFSIKDGIVSCRVIAPSKEQAMRQVDDYISVIKFIDEDDEQDR